MSIGTVQRRLFIKRYTHIHHLITTLIQRPLIIIPGDDPSTNTNKTFRTPILRKRWYEVGVIAIRVLSNTTKAQNNIMDEQTETPGEMCQQLNAEKSILDSGTTNVRLPDALFKQVCIIFAIFSSF